MLASVQVADEKSRWPHALKFHNSAITRAQSESTEVALSLTMTQSRHTSTMKRFAAYVLLATWSLVVGLEFTHQVGHMVSGCAHHAHHGEHAHQHEGCSTWDGPHDETRLVQHEHVCELCDWTFSLEVPPAVLEAPKALLDWNCVRGTGEVTRGHAQIAFWTTTGRRGPPHCG